MEYSNYYVRHLDGIKRVPREELLQQISRVGMKHLNQTVVGNTLFTDFCTPFMTEENVNTLVTIIF